MQSIVHRAEATARMNELVGGKTTDRILPQCFEKTPQVCRGMLRRIAPAVRRLG
jgi:hypothetical protein